MVLVPMRPTKSVVIGQETVTKLDFVEYSKLGQKQKQPSNIGWAYLRELLWLGAAILRAQGHISIFGKPNFTIMIFIVFFIAM